MGEGGRGGGRTKRFTCRRGVVFGRLSLLIEAKVEDSTISIAREVTGMLNLVFFIPGQWCDVQ